MANAFFVCSENFEMVKEAIHELYGEYITYEQAYGVPEEVCEGGNRLKLIPMEEYVKVLGTTSSKIRKVLRILKEDGLIESNIIEHCLWRGPIEKGLNGVYTPREFWKWIDA